MKTRLASEESNAEIKYAKSPESRNKQHSWMQVHSIELSFVVTAFVAVLGEYYFGCGTSALIISLIASLLFEVSARRHDNIPMAPCWYPIVGNYPWMLKYFDTFYDQQRLDFLEHSKKYNNGKPVPCLAISMPKRSIVVLSDPILADIVFRQQFGNAIKEKAQYDTIRPLLGNGIFSSIVQVWKVC